MLGSGGEYLAISTFFVRPKNRSGTGTRRHGIPYENGAMGFIHLEDRAVLVQKYEVYLYPIMSAPLFQANRMPECRVIFSHCTVVLARVLSNLHRLKIMC